MNTKPKKERLRFLKEVKRYWQFYLMMLPALLLIFILQYVPMPGLVLAFKNYKPADGIFGSAWADPWYKNFIFFFKSDVGKRVLFNTIFYNILQIILVTFFAILFSILMNEIAAKFFPSFYKGALLLPTFLSWIIIQYVVFALLSVDRGIVNNIIEHFGGTAISWYSESKYWRFIMPFAYLWKNVGYYSVLYVAAIAGISDEYYEAAQMDGASKWQQIRKITLPFLKPTVVITFILWIGFLFKGGLGGWDGFYTITNNSGPLYPATDVIDTYIFRSLRKISDVGMPAAAGLFQSVVGFILVLTSNLIIKKIDPESSVF